MKRRFLALTMAAVLMLVAGCGGDDGNGGGGEPAESAAPTKEEFIAEADRICAEGDAEIDQAAQEAFSQNQQTPPSPQEQEQFLTETVLPSIQEQIDGVRGLTPPEGDEDQVNEFLDSAESALQEAQEDPSILAQGPGGGGQDPFAEASRLAQEYGFEVCAQ